MSQWVQRRSQMIRSEIAAANVYILTGKPNQQRQNAEDKIHSTINPNVNIFNCQHN